MWKYIREILALLWKLIQTLIKNKLRAILMRLLFFTFLIGAAIAIIVLIVTRIFL